MIYQTTMYALLTFIFGILGYFLLDESSMRENFQLLSVVFGMITAVSASLYFYFSTKTK